MLRVEKGTPFQMACQNIRAQTCNVNFSLHRLATDTDLTKHMKWFRNSSVPDKRRPHAFSDRTYSEIRMRGLERQRTFAGFDTKNESENGNEFSVSGTKVDISDSKEKISKCKVWSQDISRSLPSVSECFTPPSLPLRPPPKRHDNLRKSNTTLGKSSGQIKLPPRPETRERPVTREQSTRERPVTRENMNDRPVTRECKTRGRKRDDDGMNDKLPSIIQEEPLFSERDKYTQTSAKRPPGGWRSLKDEQPKSSRSSKSRVSNKANENLGPTPKFLPEVQNTRDNCRRNESNLPIEPLPNIFTPATAPGAPSEKHNNIENLTTMYNLTPDTTTLTPANTLDSSVLHLNNPGQRQGTTESSLTFSSQTLTPALERSSSVKARRAPVPFRTKVAHKVFLA